MSPTCLKMGNIDLLLSHRDSVILYKFVSVCVPMVLQSYSGVICVLSLPLLQCYPELLESYDGVLCILPLSLSSRCCRARVGCYVFCHWSGSYHVAGHQWGLMCLVSILVLRMLYCYNGVYCVLSLSLSSMCCRVIVGSQVF